MHTYLPSPELVTLAQQLTAEADLKRTVLQRDLKRAIELILPILDHTILKPEATVSDIRKVCAEAIRFPFASVCVHPYWVPVVASELSGTDRIVCSVIGFPSGIHTPLVKQKEAELAIEAGATELDMVWNLGAVKSGEWEAVVEDLCAVIDVAHGQAKVKVILETTALTDNELRQGCEIALRAGASFVKTSTGFHPTGGATEQAVRIMRDVVGEEAGVKASGGIRDLRTALRMVVAGANRIGTSSGVLIAESI